MRLFILLFSLMLAACTNTPNIQYTSHTEWFKIEQLDSSGNIGQTSLLAIETFSDGKGARFVQTDALGAPISRQLLTEKGWQNDGFIMPNRESRQLFGAIKADLAQQAGVLPKIQKMPSENGATMISDGKRELWRSQTRDNSMVLTFPNQQIWAVTPLE